RSLLAAAPTPTARYRLSLHDALPISRFGEVERARADEQHVVGLHRPVLGGHGRTFDQRQQVTLHAFAADRAAAHVAHQVRADEEDRKSTRLNSSHVKISYAVFCLKKK